MRVLQKTDPAQYDKMLVDYRRLSADYDHNYGTFDAEIIAAVDKFREDHGLGYQGNPAGLVDERFVTALRTAFFEKRKTR